MNEKVRVLCKKGLEIFIKSLLIKAQKKRFSRKMSASSSRTHYVSHKNHKNKISFQCIKLKMSQCNYNLVQLHRPVNIYI